MWLIKLIRKKKLYKLNHFPQSRIEGLINSLLQIFETRKLHVFHTSNKIGCNIQLLKLKMNCTVLNINTKNNKKRNYEIL